MSAKGSEPRALGEFEVLHALKAGGMGEVLLARRRGLGGFEQLCAIKTIKPELAAAPLVRTMFLDEARLLARLTHPAIAQILAFGEQDATVYMAMEYVAGEHFRRFAERRPAPAIVCQAVAAACRGLHAAHELRDVGDGHLLGVVHRDISPDNLMLGFDGRVKVLDFGIALVKGRQAPATEFGVLKGKPPYMSPEQLRNQELDRRADVFSIAVVLHELLTGRHLFTGDSIYAVVHAVEHQAIDPPSKVVGKLPDGLDDVVMAGLERNRDHRLRSAAAMAEVLERIAAQGGGESLEAWAERELAFDRETHRRWMAGIVSGGGESKMGRATGIVTALAAAPPPTTDVDPHEEGVRATQLADVSGMRPSTEATPAGVIVAPQTDLAAAADVVVPERGGTMSTELASEPPRGRRSALVAVLAVFALVGLVLVIALGRKHAVTAPPADAAPAVIDALAPPPAIDAPVAIDAMAVIDVPADAAEVDASVRVRDAGVRREPVDARPLLPIDARAAERVDAAVVKGMGTLAVRVTPAADISVDGEAWGSSPFAKPIAAGSHLIIARDPEGGAEVLRKTVQVEPGETERVLWP